MGYRDYAGALSITQSVGADADSTYYVDTDVTNPGWNRGMPAAVIINCKTTPGAGTTGIDFQICHNTSEPTVDSLTLAIFRVPIADIVAGAEFILAIPRGVTLLRYLRLYYNLITGDEITGIFDAYFTPLPI